MTVRSIVYVPSSSWILKDASYKFDHNTAKRVDYRYQWAASAILTLGYDTAQQRSPHYL
jgi:hypothetical protein